VRRKKQKRGLEKEIPVAAGFSLRKSRIRGQKAGLKD